MAHRPKHAWFEFQSDQKQHHHHAKLSVVLQGYRFVTHQTDDGTDDDACDEVAQHRAQSEALCQGNRDDGRTQIDKGMNQVFRHD